MYIVFITVCGIFLGAAESVDLGRSKQCGELQCKQYDYCASQELICKPCKLICEEDSHNFDEIRCSNSCLDYINDFKLGYARKSDVQALSDTISKIYLLLVVILILVVLLLTMVSGMFVRILFRYRKRALLRKLEEKKFNQKHSSVQYTVSNSNVISNDPIRTISQTFRNSMPSTTTLSQTESPLSTNKSICTTKTLPLSMEEPCETTLDYAAYVNQALSHSPSNDTELNASPKF